MNRTIAPTESQSNTFFSQSATINNLETEIQHNQPMDGFMPIASSIIKLNKSQRLILSTVNFFTVKGDGCFMGIEAWRIKLVEMGGKALCYRQMKYIFKKLRDLSLIDSRRTNGDRNKPYIYKSTEKGKLLIENLSTKSINDTVKKLPIEKNCPSKQKKLPLEAEKTAPRTLPTPNCINTKKIKDHDHVNVILPKSKQGEVKTNNYLLKRLMDSGFYIGPALGVLSKQSESQIMAGLEISKYAKNPGGLMQDYFKNPDKYKTTTPEAAKCSQERKCIEFDQSTGDIKKRPVDEANSEYARNVAYHEQMAKYAAQRAARQQKQ